VSFDQVADTLPYDPVIARNRVAGLLEIAQQLGARATDVVPFVGDDVIL
jgi:hypothetical protein